MLARYSGEFTGECVLACKQASSYQYAQVFRELLQNSDDASASAVEIHFETKKYLDRKNGKADTPEDDASSLEEDGLPDLKTTVVSNFVACIVGLDDQ